MPKSAQFSLVKFLLSSLVILLLSFILGSVLPSQSLADVKPCSIMSNYVITPTTWRGDSSQVFEFSGTLSNCANSASRAISPINIALINPDGDGWTPPISTDAQGRFDFKHVMSDEDGKTHEGVWTVRFTWFDGNNGGDVTDEAGNIISNPITITAANVPIACGTVDVGQDAKCAEGCKRVTVYTGKYACMTDQQKKDYDNAAQHDAENGCYSPSEVTDTCDTKYKLLPIYSCLDTAKIRCNDGATKICKSPTAGNSTDILNFECQTNDIDDTIPKAPPFPPPCAVKITDDGCLRIDTAIAAVGTDPQGLIKKMLALFLSLSGGIALIMIIRAGYQLMTSQGTPEKVKEAQDRVISAVTGLIFIILSLVILEIIGVNILNLPGLSH